MIRTAPFFAAALMIALTFGGALGSIVLASRHLPWPGFSPPVLEAARTVHGHALVFGFAALFVMGVAYHALPRLSGVALARPRLARATLWLQTGGVMAYALATLAGPWRDPLAAAAASVLLAGAVAFTRVVEQAVGSLARGAPAAPWLRAGAWWLVVAALLDVAATAGARALQPVVWEAALYGFVAAWIFGMSMQFLPILLGRDLVPVRTDVFAWYQLSVTASVLATILLVATHPLRTLAAASLAAAAFTVVLRLDVFGSPRRAGHGTATAGDDDDGGATRFLLTAYGWLLASLACGPGWRAIAGMRGSFAPLLAEDFARHALTLGFLTQMIVGVTSRLVPAFSGRPLWSDRARGATYWLLNAAVVTRGLQVVVESGGPWALWPWIAASGPLALAALTIFTIALIRGARPAQAG